MTKTIGTLKTTLEILEKYELKAKKNFGQNFIIDENIIDKIIKQANVTDETLVLEVGPGIGALTQKLTQKAKQVYSFEIDTSLQGVHEEYLNYPNLRIVYRDFLTVNINDFLDRQVPQYDHVCLIANLPYYITSKLLEIICLSNSRIGEIVIMIQKEVAHKLMGDHINPLHLMINDICDVEYCFTVSNNVFIPKPRVESAVIKLTKHSYFDRELYKLVCMAFSHRRKTILNNLSPYYQNVGDALDEAGIDRNFRPEQLKMKDYSRIHNIINRI